MFVNGGPRAAVRTALVLLLPLALVACGSEAASLERAGAPAAAQSTTGAPTAAAEVPTTVPVVTQPPTTAVPTTLPPPTTISPPTTVAVPHVVVQTGYSPFAVVEQLVLFHPAAEVEVVGFHRYCEHRDDYAVIDPDGRPGWEVKLLHIDGVQVEAGQRVEAGVTVVAPRPTRLPFGSQVDDHTGTPPWPHVHVEVVDPSIPDRPDPGGDEGC